MANLSVTRHQVSLRRRIWTAWHGKVFALLTRIPGLPTARLPGREYASLREHKASIYEGGHRKPFMALWRSRIESGQTSDQIISITDIFATCADLLEISLSQNVAEDSVNFLDCLYGEQQ